MRLSTFRADPIVRWSATCSPPSRFALRRPAVLCLHGHGRGVDDIVGIREDGTMRSRRGGYQKDFALQCVRRGYVVLAIEQIGFGHRRDAAARAARAGSSSCQPAAGAALLLGQTMIGWRVWDAIRSIDYLATRPEVEADRLAVMGISGGGATSFFTAALDHRMKAAVVSGYFCTFRDSIFSIQHCIDNYIPGILRYAEMYDVAGLIAPRSLFVETGTDDRIFPVEATRYAVGKDARDVPRHGRGGPAWFRGVRRDAPVPRRWRVRAPRENAVGPVAPGPARTGGMRRDIRRCRGRRGRRCVSAV